MSSATRYVPAAGHAALTALYDPVLGLTMRESRWRGRVAALAVEGFTGGETVVDVGAGTGAQSLAIAAACREARVVAVDGDPRALAIAQRKAAGPADPRGGIDWRVGLAQELPVETASAAAVVMALLLHHLDADGKRAALSEAARVLGPGGRLVVADWGPPRGLVPALGFRALTAIDGAAGTADHAAARVPAYITAAGFEPPSPHARLATVWGTLELLSARRP